MIHQRDFLETKFAIQMNGCSQTGVPFQIDSFHTLSASIR